MIARVWRGEALPAGADAYQRHFDEAVAPALRRIPGHRGALLLRREDASSGRTEFLAVTLWASMDAVTAFAGATPDRAVVEPEARAALAAFDDFVRHFEVVHAGGETLAG